MVLFNDSDVFWVYFHYMNVALRLRHHRPTCQWTTMWMIIRMWPANASDVTVFGVLILAIMTLLCHGFRMPLDRDKILSTFRLWLHLYEIDSRNKQTKSVSSGNGWLYKIVWQIELIDFMRATVSLCELCAGSVQFRFFMTWANVQ